MMKKAISILSLCFLLVGMLCSCGTQPLSLTTDTVTKIALSPANGGTITIKKAEDVTAILLAMENATCTTSNTKQDSLPGEEYRFTTYDSNNVALNTMILYGNEYLQVDTTLYKGTLADLQTIFSNLCKASSLQDLSSVFSSKTQDITEIAFYNNTEKTFKIVTRQDDIQLVLSPLQALKTSENAVSGEPMQEITLYFRLKNTNEYLPAIEIIKYDTGTLCKVGGKSTPVSNYKWDVLYNKLSYNEILIK